MTILAVDAGNTRIKWAMLAKGMLNNAGQTERPHSVDLFQAFAMQYWMPLARPERVVVANVAGVDFGGTLAAWVKQAWDIEAEFAVPQRSAYGIRNAYLDPQKLGVDRWAGMIAAHPNAQGARRKKANGAVCVIGCGTAITFDVLTARGEHQGGLIVPGLTLMRRALLENTQDILNKMGDAMSGASAEISLLARDTPGGVNGGTLYAVISVIDRVTADLAAELGQDMARIITGGDAPALLPLLSGHYRHEPLLVLQGLAIIAQATPHEKLLPGAPKGDERLFPVSPPAEAAGLPCIPPDAHEPPHPGAAAASGILDPSLCSPVTLVPPCRSEDTQ